MGSPLPCCLGHRPFPVLSLHIHTPACPWGVGPALGCGVCSPQWPAPPTSCASNEQPSYPPGLRACHPEASFPPCVHEAPSQGVPWQPPSSPGWQFTQGSPSFYLGFLNILLRKISGTHGSRGSDTMNPVPIEASAGRGFTPIPSTSSSSAPSARLRESQTHVLHLHMFP